VLWSACDQVMEIGINHKVASTVPEYLGKIAMLGGHVRLGAVTNSERAINMRFKHPHAMHECRTYTPGTPEYK